MNDTLPQTAETDSAKRKSLSIPEDVHSRLKSLADADYRGVTDQLAWLVDQELARRAAADADAA